MILTLTGHWLRRLWPLLLLPALLVGAVSAAFVLLIEPLGGLAVMTRYIQSVPAVGRLMGAAGLDPTTHSGLASMAYVHPFIAVVTLVWPLSIAAVALAGSVEIGLADHLLSRAAPRRIIPIAATLTLAIGSMLTGFAIWLGTAIGAWISLEPGSISLGHFMLGSVVISLEMIAVGSVALLISAMSEDRGRVLGACVVLWLISYFNGRLSPIFGSLAWLEPWSLQGHCRPVGTIREGVLIWSDVFTVLAVTLASFLLTLWVWRRRDIRS